MQKSSPSSMWLFAAAGLVVVGLIAFAVIQGRTPSPYESFAQCLTDKNVKMYGAWWCSHCQNQKNLFGNAFKNVTYIECSPNGSKTFSSQECVEAEIKSTPTWVFGDGSRVPGEMSLEDLAEKSTCELPENS